MNHTRKDALTWMHERDVNYTVKSGYKAIQGWKTFATDSPSSSHNDTNIWKNIWALPTIPRHKIML